MLFSLDTCHYYGGNKQVIRNLFALLGDSNLVLPQGFIANTIMVGCI